MLETLYETISREETLPNHFKCMGQRSPQRLSLRGVGPSGPKRVTT